MNRHLLQQQLIPLDLVRENKTNVEIIPLKQTMSRIPAAHMKELLIEPIGSGCKSFVFVILGCGLESKKTMGL
jgi:hypothetical protein